MDNLTTYSTLAGTVQIQHNPAFDGPSDREAIANWNRDFEDMLMWGRETHRQSRNTNEHNIEMVTPSSIWRQPDSSYVSYYTYGTRQYHYDMEIAEEVLRKINRQKTQREIEDEMDARGEIELEF